jgi:hypothetical protein
MALLAFSLLVSGLLAYILLWPSNKEEKKIHHNDPSSSTLVASSAQKSFKPLEKNNTPSPKSLPDLPPSSPTISEKNQIIDKVRDASTTYDAASLPIIEPYLYSPDPEVRGEAVNAIVNLGDKAGAALLRKYAEKESDLERKLEILKLADWLELPSGKFRLSKKKTRKHSHNMKLACSFSE